MLRQMHEFYVAQPSCAAPTGFAGLRGRSEHGSITGFTAAAGALPAPVIEPEAGEGLRRPAVRNV